MSETSTANTTPGSAGDDDRALGLCCIGRSSELMAPVGIGYESDQSLRAIDEGPLRAVVIDLDAAYLTGSSARGRLESEAWLSLRAARHDAIIAEAAASSPVIPARFGSLFTGEEPLRQMLAEHESLLWNALDTVDSAVEFTVRILVDRQRAVDAMISGEGPGPVDADQPLGSWLARRVQKPMDAVQEVARAACRHRIVERECDGLEILANWAFLVGLEDRPAFEEAIGRAARALEDIGAEVACGGPWAPYSFAPSVAAA